MVHGVLESDEDESLSEFIESESQISDCGDEDDNQLFFVPAITNIRLSSFPDPLIGLSFFKTGKIFYVFMGALWVYFLKSSIGTVKFSLLRYYQCLDPLFFSHQKLAYHLCNIFLRNQRRLEWNFGSLLRLQLNIIYVSRFILINSKCGDKTETRFVLSCCYGSYG